MSQAINFTLIFICLIARQAISLLANLNARKRANAPVVYGSGLNQATQATKLSTLAFAPTNRPAAEGIGINDSVVTSLPVHSLVQTNIQNGSIIYTNIAEESDRCIEEKSDVPVDENHSTFQANIV